MQGSNAWRENKLPPFPPSPRPRRFSPLQPDLPEPAPTRTQFAVNLQLGRSFSSLVLLVRYGYEGHTAQAHVEARLIASAILHGARDRSREPHLRTLRDQQRRSAPLHKKRPKRRTVPRLRKVAISSAAPLANGTQSTVAPVCTPAWRAQLRPLKVSRPAVVEHAQPVHLRHRASAYPLAVHILPRHLWNTVDWPNLAPTAQVAKVAA